MNTFMSIFGTDYEQIHCMGMLRKILDLHVHFMLIEFLKVAGHNSGDKFLAPLHVLDSQPLLFWAQLYIQTSLLQKRKEENRRKILVKDFEQVWGGNFIFKPSTWLVLLGWSFFAGIHGINQPPTSKRLATNLVVNDNPLLSEKCYGSMCSIYLNITYRLCHVIKMCIV